MDKKPVSTELTPIPHSSSDSPQQRTVPRKSVAFGYYVTICVRNATHPRLRLSAAAARKPQVEVALI